MANPADATEVVPYLTSAATIVFIQKWMKNRAFYQQFVKAFPGADRYAHWFMAGVMSLIAAAGIHYTWQGSLNEGGTLVLAIPKLVDILHGMSDWFKVYILQHTIHGSQVNVDVLIKSLLNAVGAQPPDPPKAA